MIDRKIETLMWQHIDGTIGAEDRKYLEAELERSAEARSRFEEMNRLVAVFAEVRGHEIDPPPALRRRIEAAIDPDRYRPARKSFVAAFSGLFSLRPSLRYAVAAGFGVLVGVIGYQVLGSRVGEPAGLDISRLSGTMMERPGSDVRLVETEGIRGTIDIRYDDRTATIELRLSSTETVDVLIDYADWPLRFGAVGDADDAVHTVSVDDGSVVFTNLGSGTFYAVLDRSAAAQSPVRVEFRRGETVVAEEILDVQDAR